MVSRGQQKRPRKKPAPQAPRNAAIPVAMPKAPSVIPPRQLPPSTKMDPEYVEAISTPPSQVSPREEIKQRAKEAERKKIKDEKRRLKEAEKEAKETRKANSNKLKASNSVQVVSLDDFRASAEDPIP